jgi:hypothetical protein
MYFNDNPFKRINRRWLLRIWRTEIWKKQIIKEKFY